VIVERGHVGLIRSGRRTQTRKLVDGREPGYRVRRGRRGQSHSLSKPWVPKVGDRLPIQTVGEHAELYVVVTSVHTEPAGAITRETAQACGYMTVVGWKAAWVREHGKEWVARERERQIVRATAADCGLDLSERALRRFMWEAEGDGTVAAVRVEMAHAGDELDPADAKTRTPDAAPVLATVTAAQLAARFDDHHADQLVWVIDHAVATDEPYNLLAARPGSAQVDYVSSPAQAMGGDLDPGEAVDREALEKLNERDAERRDLEAKQRWLALRVQLEKGIRELEALGELTPSQQKHLARLRHQLAGGDKRFVEKAA
jgi:hypothetical protein